MKKTFFIVLILFLIFAQTAYAESSASVKINNNVSSNSQSESSIKTDIRVETNGHVTTYSSEEAEDIEIKAENDQSVIKVNGKTVSGGSPTGTATPTAQPTDEPEDNKTEEDNENIFDIIEDIFNKVFSLLG